MHEAKNQFRCKPPIGKAGLLVLYLTLLAVPVVWATGEPFVAVFLALLGGLLCAAKRTQVANH